MGVGRCRLRKCVKSCLSMRGPREGDVLRRWARPRARWAAGSAIVGTAAIVGVPAGAPFLASEVTCNSDEMTELVGAGALGAAALPSTFPTEKSCAAAELAGFAFFAAAAALAFVTLVAFPAFSDVVNVLVVVVVVVVVVDFRATVTGRVIIFPAAAATPANFADLLLVIRVIIYSWSVP